MDYNDYAKAAFEASVDKGWYENVTRSEPLPAATLDQLGQPAGWVSVVDGWQRNAGEQIALIHSEITEFYEALRSGSMSEKLPHRAELEEETADIAIRVFDFCGARDLDLQEGYDKSCLVPFDMSDDGMANHMHRTMSHALEALRKDRDCTEHFGLLIKVLEHISIELDFDFLGSVDDKMAFNRTRPHKHGGKKF